MIRKVLTFCCSILLFTVLAGCGESDEEVFARGYEVGYEDGYNEGQGAACEELESVAPGIRQRLESCERV